jgi:hypothetical protein
MRALTAQEIIGVWELGQHQTPVEKALTILGRVYPDRAPESIAALSIGQRDLRLLLLRELTLGPTLESIAECPHCREGLEFSMKVRDICVDRVVEEPREFTMEADGYEITYRLLDSADQLAIASCGDLTDARDWLVRRCVKSVRLNGAAVEEGEDLPEPVIARLAEHVASSDPQAEVLLDLNCAICGHTWQVFFDVATYFVDELRSTVVKLLREVHYIARAYGWSESEILAMSDAKRKFYMEMV